jgi:hypothetical protein
VATAVLAVTAASEEKAAARCSSTPSALARGLRGARRGSAADAAALNAAARGGKTQRKQGVSGGNEARKSHQSVCVAGKARLLAAASSRTHSHQLTRTHAASRQRRRASQAQTQATLRAQQKKSHHRRTHAASSSHPNSP